MERLRGKIAIVTGATSGMGRAIAELFAAEGAAVVLSGRHPERGLEVLNGLRQRGCRAEFVAGDVREFATHQELVATALSAFGGIDILVPNAGILGLGSVTEVPLEVWDEAIATNLHGVFYLCRAGIPKLLERGAGSIVINASIAAFKTFPNHAAYCASKGALVPLAKQMAREYAPQIRVNVICPGPVDTPLIWDSARAFPDPSQAVRNAAQTTLLKRLGEPSDVAQAALFLASEQARWITGAVLNVDGGVLA
jgi:NAD(P)-dependent dehydrogenase (short-subunit alcohol dehydrogenase family)